MDQMRYFEDDAEHVDSRSAQLYGTHVIALSRFTKRHTQAFESWNGQSYVRILSSDQMTDGKAQSLSGRFLLAMAVHQS